MSCGSYYDLSSFEEPFDFSDLNYFHQGRAAENGQISSGFFIAKEEIFPADGKRQHLSTPALERVRVSPRLIWTGYRGSWQLSESGHNVPVCKTLTAVSTQDSMIL